MNKRIFLSILLAASVPVYGAQVLVRPSQAGRATDTMIFTDQASSFADASVGFQVRMNVSCFGTNLRSVANPVSPASSVKFSMAFRSGGTFSVVFPGWMVMNTNYSTMVPSPAPLAIVNGGMFYVDKSPDSRDWPYEPANRQPSITSAYGNTIIFNAPPNLTTGLSFNGTSYTNADFSSLISEVQIIQDVYSVVGQVKLVKLEEEQKIKPWKIQTALSSFMTPLKWISWGATEKSYAGGDGGDGGGDGGGGTINDQGAPVAVAVPLLQGPDANTDAGWGQPRFAWWEQIKTQESIVNPIPNPHNYTNTPSDVQRFMGKDGPLSANWEATWSSDMRVLNINASFPGQVDFCGGFFSPLMLFFDHQEPQFNRYVNFKMSSYADQTYWPEPELNAAFLVLDRNGDGIINDVTEMFGSEDSSMNGFEMLAAFDENGDGVIDAKDSIYPKLKLWRDSTGTGKTLKKDLVSLKEAGVESISLRYEKSAAMGIGNRAELRERSSFNMVRNGKRTKGEVIDVWFASKR
ncbi:MAG: hypothetical protein JSU04_00720 [Bdellovibrionales bacterium]|nr:hypothetical protein [Bdellovibrionales bacterium]